MDTAATMKAMIFRNIQMMALISISLPLIMGVMAERMMTWATSSTTVTRTTVSTSSLVSLIWSFRTTVTTAVDDPDIIAPNTMDWSESRPSREPPR